MSAVALATAGRLPDGMADTSGLIAALGEAGVTGALVEWDDAGVDWRDFDLVVPHCPWDYLERRVEFFGWLAELDQRGKLPNSHRLLCWNVDKRYLLELRDQGISIPETMIFEAGESVRSGQVEQLLGSGPLVVKPAVGGGGRRVWRCRSALEAARLAGRELVGERVVIQRFEESVAVQGEYSAVFFDGELSHVVRKRPKPGEFRVHGRYGASTHVVDRQQWIADYGRRVLARLPVAPLYARVDFLLPQPRTPLLMEVELIDPDLFLRMQVGAWRAFAAALAVRSGSPTGVTGLV